MRPASRKAPIQPPAATRSFPEGAPQREDYKARGDYWAWQGDGTDDLSSLVCPVLIPAKTL